MQESSKGKETTFEVGYAHEFDICVCDDVGQMVRPHDPNIPHRPCFGCIVWAISLVEKQSEQMLNVLNETPACLFGLLGNNEAEAVSSNIETVSGLRSLSLGLVS